MTWQRETNDEGEVLLRSVIEIPETIDEGKYVIDLSKAFADLGPLIADYVVTDQLQEAFVKALGLVRNAVREQVSRAAYLHGSFGSGKSHFMAMLAAALNGDPRLRGKRSLQEVLSRHDDWLTGRRFMLVPFHLPGSESLDAAVLGGYAKYVRENFPDALPPLVHPDDLLLEDAREERKRIGDEKFLAALTLPEDATWGGINVARIDRGFTAAPGDPDRRDLVRRLLAGPFRRYSTAVQGTTESYLPLENGLAEISTHAKSLGFDAVILFLDELILWLMGRQGNQDFVQREAAKLVKLVESGDMNRPVPIVSLISRQRDISTLLGASAVGAEEDALRRNMEHNSGRFGVINLEDKNLPTIARERVLTPRVPEARAVLSEEFRKVESERPNVWDALMDSKGATHADREDFRTAYPFSPALLNTLVALSAALQRQRTGLKLLAEMLHRRRDELTVGQLIPLGDLWDVLVDGRVEAFSDHLKREFDDAVAFHRRARAYLREEYGAEDGVDYVNTDRIVKTLLLASLAPDVSALSRLTGERLSALNHGTFRSAIPGNEGTVVAGRLQKLAGRFGELRVEGTGKAAVFTLHLTELDADPVLERVQAQDTVGARRNWVQSRLWELLGVKETNQFWGEREIIWRGTRRVVEFIYGNVREELRTSMFEPGVPGRVRVVLGMPFDDEEHAAQQAVTRVNRLRADGVDQPTAVWLPSHLSEARQRDLGRLVLVSYLLERDRLDDYADYLTTEERARLRNQLETSKGNLESSLLTVLAQAYGVVRPDDANLGSQLERNIFSLREGHDARLPIGLGFADCALALGDGLYDTLYPGHPNFDPGPFERTRHAVTPAEIRTTWAWIQRAAEAGDPPRVVVDSKELGAVRRIMHPLELGEVTDGPLVLTTRWRREIDRRAGDRPNRDEDVEVRDIYAWLDEAGYKGLDKLLRNLIVGTYALQADRAWVRYDARTDQPALEDIGPEYALRAQDLPSEEQFAAALRRAQGVFGVSDVAPFRSARNTARLARQVREVVERTASDVKGVRHSLGKHAAALGTDEDADRVTSAKAAARLVTELRNLADDTALVRALANVDTDDVVTDTVLGAAIVAAGPVLAALDGTNWGQLTTLRMLCERGDSLAERAERALAELADAAGHTEFARKLAPALRRAQDQALALANEAIGAITPPTPPPPAPTPPVSGPAGISVPLPPVQGTLVPRRGARRARGPAVEAELAAVREEIARVAAADPDAEFEITWRAVDRTGAESV